MLHLPEIGETLKTLINNNNKFLIVINSDLTRLGKKGNLTHTAGDPRFKVKAMFRMY